MDLEPDEVARVLLRERRRIAAVVVAVLRDAHAADDVFQQVVLTALQHRARFRDPDHVLAWGLRAARHRAIDLARRKGVRCLPAAALDALEAGWHEEPVSDHADALRRCLGKLLAPARRLLAQRYDDGLAVAVIAERSGRTPDAVYQNLSRLHRLLRVCVGRELDPSEPQGCERGVAGAG